MQAISQPSIAVRPSACKNLRGYGCLEKIFLLDNLGWVGLYRVENVDQNQKDGDEERHSARYNLLDQTIILYCSERHDQKLMWSGNDITDLFSNMGQLCL